MPSTFRSCAETTERLFRAVHALEKRADSLQVAPLAGREWYELLRQKLLPQLRDDAFLVIAVVGGTNIGKSVVFNHLAGCRASSTSPLASGTKHPVCLVPPGFVDKHDLQAIFADFALCEWSSSDQALGEAAEHRLFWRTSGQTPENLLVLDTPDIDSDAPINWHRADGIRRAADVLIAVLTQQKYNDAAVKQFFRTAAEEDKAVIVLFNQCQLPEDEEYWPLWAGTFCGETGVAPEVVYVAPNDRAAAEENRLPFYERPWPQTVGESPADAAPRSLAEDLSRLRFAEIKLRTLRGSLARLCDDALGAPSYLRDVGNRSRRFQSAAELLSQDRLARTDDWPPVPNGLLVARIREWWREQREGWSAKVHGFYNSVGRGLTWPFRYVKGKVQAEQRPPQEVYLRSEWKAILDTVNKAYDHLMALSDAGHELLHNRLENILGGDSRKELLAKLEAAHSQVDIDEELDRLVTREMESFREESPRFYGFLKKLDKTAAVVRPATSVILFMTGFGPAGDAAAHIVADSAVQSVVHVAGDLTGGTVAAAVGDQAISGTASSGMGYVEAKFRKMHAAFTARRVEWLLALLNEHLWGSLLDELTYGAGLPQSADYGLVETTLNTLRQQLDTAASAVVESQALADNNA